MLEKLNVVAFMLPLLVVSLAAVFVLWLKNSKAGLRHLELESKLIAKEEALTSSQLEVQTLAAKSEQLEVRCNEANMRLASLNEALNVTRQDVDTGRELRFEAEKTAEGLKVKLEESASQLSLLRADFDLEKALLKTAQNDYQILLEKHSSMSASLQERETQHLKQLESFDQQKKMLEQSFQNLANRIFEEKGKSFSHTSKESLEQLLKPFREQITEFRTRVDGIQKENNESTGSLRKELEQLRHLNQSMTADAKNLTEALKGDKKKVGSWGEVQLEKTLQLAGLVKGDHYDTQAHFKDEHGKNNFPDFVVKLPDDKHIVLDSKVSLIDYDAAIAADTDELLFAALDKHVQAVKNHIDNLAAKDYTNLIGMKSPSFVLMFMPIEPAYIEAMKHNRDVFNYGYQKGVIMVSHTTLMPILKTVANLWMIERSNLEAKEVSDRAGEVYNQVCVIAERLQKLGGTLLTASKQYNSAVVAVAGQQGLHGKVERFNKLSNKVTKSMPALEPVHADIDSDRLDVIRVESLLEDDGLLTATDKEAP